MLLKYSLGCVSFLQPIQIPAYHFADVMFAWQEFSWLGLKMAEICFVGIFLAVIKLAEKGLTVI